MTARSTLYSEIESSIVRELKTTMTVTGMGAGTLADLSIMHYNGEVDLSGNSLAEWEQVGAPCVVVAIEGIADEVLTQEGGRHPRSYWETLDIGIYCFDNALRADPQEAMDGFDATDRCRGIWKLMSDIRATLTGADLVDMSSVSLGWEGPKWTGARKIADGQRLQLWRLGCEYAGAVKFTLDTSALSPLTMIHGDFNEGNSTDPPDVEINVPLP